MKKTRPSAAPAAAPASRTPRPRVPARRAASALTVSRPELLPGGSDAAFRRLVHNLLALGARHMAVRAGHGAFIGLTGVEYTMLISIGHLASEGDVSVTLLARHLHLSGPFATITVNKLMQEGLVEKCVDANDRRRVCLTLTTAGQALLNRLAPVQRQVNDVQFGSLSAAEFRSLSVLLEKLIGSSDEALRLQAYLAAQGR